MNGLTGWWTRLGFKQLFILLYISITTQLSVSANYTFTDIGAVVKRNESEKPYTKSSFGMYL